MNERSPIDYPPLIASLRSSDRVPSIGPGSPNQSARPLLERLASPDAFAPREIIAKRGADACRAGLWLLHDFLAESHAISQSLDTAEGSFWHAIMHRREPDAGNSKYWWRAIGAHPVLEMLAKESPSVGYQFTTPQQFVDYCERHRGTGSAEERLAEQVQLLEWRLLFDWCFRKAVGDS